MSIAISNKKEDRWASNIHVTHNHEDTLIPKKLKEHHQLLNENDKFINFVNHVEHASLLKQ
jgi:hypothetical protein